MVLSLLGIVISMTCTTWNHGVDTNLPTVSSTVDSINDYNVTYIIQKSYSNLGLPLVDDEYIFDSYFDFYYTLSNGTNARIEFGRYSLGFDFVDNGSSFTLTSNIYHFLDNSDLEGFNNFNILPYFNIIYYLGTTPSDDSFVYSMGLYDTEFTGISTQYDFNVSRTDTITTSSDTLYLNNVYISFGFIQFSSPDYSDDIVDSYNSGYNAGKTDGYNLGSQDGESTGYQKGYYDAKNIYENQSANISSIFTGILDVGMLPLNFFLTIFNFEIFGINIAGIVGGVLTIFLLVMMIRFVLGGKDGD